jgi:hypothetical protein
MDCRHDARLDPAVSVRWRTQEIDQLVDLAGGTALEEVPDVYRERRDDGFLILLEIEQRLLVSVVTRERLTRERGDSERVDARKRR